MNFQSLPQGFPQIEFHRILKLADWPASCGASVMANSLRIAHTKAEGERGETYILQFFSSGDQIKVGFFKDGQTHIHAFSCKELRDLKRQL